MSTTDSDSLWTEFSELSKTVKRLQKKDLLADKTKETRLNLRTKCREFIHVDIDRAVSSDILLNVWKLCFYKPIEHFRKVIRNLEKKKKKSSSAEIEHRLSAARTELIAISQDAIRFFDEILFEGLELANIQYVYRDAADEKQHDSVADASSSSSNVRGGMFGGGGSPFASNSQIDDDGDYNFGGMMFCVETSAFVDRLAGGDLSRFDEAEFNRMWWALQICHKCLLYLGDLWRYITLCKPDDDPTRDFSMSRRYYRFASRLLPSRGNPHNQLAVLATYDSNHLRAIYEYFLSLSVRKPFDTAKGNVSLVFQKIRKLLQKDIHNGLMNSTNSNLRNVRVNLWTKQRNPQAEGDSSPEPSSPREQKAQPSMMPPTELDSSDSGSAGHSAGGNFDFSMMSLRERQSLIIHLRNIVAQITSVDVLATYVIYIFSAIYSQSKGEMDLVHALSPCLIDRISELVLDKLSDGDGSEISGDSDEAVAHPHEEKDDLSRELGRRMKLKKQDRMTGDEKKLEVVRQMMKRRNLLSFLFEMYICVIYLINYTRGRLPPECVGYREIVTFGLLLTSAMMRHLTPSRHMEVLWMVSLGCDWLSKNLSVIVPDLNELPWKHMDVNERDLEAPNEFFGELANLLNVLSELPDCTSFDFVNKVNRLVPIEHEMLGTALLDIDYIAGEQHAFFEERRDISLRIKDLMESPKDKGDDGNDDDFEQPLSQASDEFDESEDEPMEEAGNGEVKMEEPSPRNLAVSDEEFRARCAEFNNTQSYLRLERLAKRAAEEVASVFVHNEEEGWVAAPLRAVTDEENQASQPKETPFNVYGNLSGGNRPDQGFHTFDPFGLQQPQMDPRLLLHLTGKKSDGDTRSGGRKNPAQSSSPPPLNSHSQSYAHLFGYQGGEEELEHAANSRNTVFSASGTLLKQSIRRQMAGQVEHRALANGHGNGGRTAATQDMAMIVQARRQEMIDRLGGPEKYFNQGMAAIRASLGNRLQGGPQTQFSRGSSLGHPHQQGQQGFMSMHDLGSPMMNDQQTHQSPPPPPRMDGSASPRMQQHQSPRQQQPPPPHQGGPHGGNYQMPQWNEPVMPPTGPPEHQHEMFADPYLLAANPGAFGVPQPHEQPLPMAVPQPQAQPQPPQPTTDGAPIQLRGSAPIYHPPGYYPYYLPPGRTPTPEN